MIVRRVALGYYVAALVLSGAYFLSSSSREAALLALAVVSASAIVFGVRHYRPRTAWCWYLLAAAVVAEPVGTIIYDALPGSRGILKPWNWIPWVIQGLMLVLIVAALLGLSRSVLHRSSAAIDGAIILLGAGLIGGLTVAVPYAHAATGIVAAVRVAYVLRDVVIFALVVHLATALRLSRSVSALLLGMFSFVTYDVIYRIGRSRGVRVTGDVLDVGLLAFVILLGTAALMASMTWFDTPALPDGRDSLIRLGLVVLLALIPSVVLLVALFHGPPPYRAVTVITSSLILVLALARIMDVARQLSRQVRGERIVRDTVVELAGAPRVGLVAPVLERAVRRIFAESARVGVVVMRSDTALRDGRIEGLAADGDFLDARLLSAEATGVLATSGSFFFAPIGPAMGGYEPQQLLLVRGPRTALIAARERLETLAKQAEFAIERIGLSEENLRHSSEAYFRTLIQNSTDVILILDDDERIRYASPSATGVFGTIPVVGAHLPDLVAAGDRSHARLLLSNVRAGYTESPPHGDWVVRRNKGTAARVEVSCRDLRNDPTIRGLVLTLRNVTQQRLLEHELKRQALHDPLTGLANRLPFTERLNTAVKNRGRSRAAVIYADLDDFKMVNDIYGHETGDVVLLEVGERLTRLTRTYGGPDRATAARLGGDEFAILLTGLTDADAADGAAARLIAAMAEPLTIQGVEVTCAVSVGVATTDEDVQTGGDLLGNADLALYAAKAAGKSESRHYEPSMRSTLSARREIRSLLEKAIDDDRLALEYQPIVELSTNETVGFEALLRWDHPTRGRLSPGSFIEVAEESGLIIPIGEWALATAARAAASWNGLAPYVSVNVSARQFRSPGFAAGVLAILSETDLSPELLMLEITESLLLRDEENVWRDLYELRRHGIRIAIDDFGTGYSALSYLRHVPLDSIKLDRSFTQSMVASSRQRDLVHGIVGLADILGLGVITEGIETFNERDVARQIGCTYGQGFFFSRPLTPPQVAQWLRDRRHS